MLKSADRLPAGRAGRENFLSRRVLSHRGQAGRSAPRTSNSKSCPQAEQGDSWIGMVLTLEFKPVSCNDVM